MLPKDIISAFNFGSFTEINQFIIDSKATFGKWGGRKFVNTKGDKKPSRIAVEQAKGMIAAHSEGDMHATFARLRTFAADHHRGLTDVAEALVAGTLAVDSLTTKPTPTTADDPDDSTFTAHSPTEEGHHVIHAHGELDMATRSALFEACAINGDVMLAVDLSAVTLMDCNAYRAFLAARLELEQRQKERSPSSIQPVNLHAYLR